MNLKLEELRKRLLESSAPPAPPVKTIFERSSMPTQAGEVSGSERENDEWVAGDPSDTVAPNDVTGNMLQYVKQSGGLRSGAKSMEQLSQYQVAQAVAKLFEPTKGFQERLEELTSLFDSIERLGESAARIFGPVKAFYDQFAQLAQMFEPLKDFHQQLALMSRTFEPTRALHEQLTQLAEAFQVHLTQLVRALEPAKAFQVRIADLARAFEPATTLQDQFAGLARSLKVTAKPDGSAA